MKTVLVLGFHRGGTSLVANVIQKMGVQLWTRPEQEMKAFEHNKKGYYENWDFVHLNDAILKEAGGDWMNPPSRQAISRAGLTYINDIKRLVRENMATPLWGWKDPRTCLTCHLYEPYLENLHIIMPIRSVEANFASFYKTRMSSVHESTARKHFNKLRIRYFNDAYRLAQNYPNKFIKFENFFVKEWYAPARRIAEFLEVDFNGDLLRKLEKEVSPKIRNF